MSQIIKKLTPDTYALWNDYVLSHIDGTCFHLIQWKEAVEKAFGHPSYYFYLEEDGQIVGILPMIQVKSRLFGNILSSLPFAAYGGPIANTDSELDLLVAHAQKITVDLEADYLDLKFIEAPKAQLGGTDLYVTFIKEIFPDHDTNLKMIPRKQRAMVRKGIRSGLEIDCSANYLDEFYKIFACNVQRMGTPVYAKKWFATLLDVFGEKSELHVVKSDGKVISGVLSFYHKETVLPYYAASLVEYRNLAPNDFQYWMLMKDAVERGCRYFDYGRSKIGTGPYQFKKHWGFEPAQLHYKYYLNKLDTVPEINPLNPKYRFKIEAWKRLPAVVAKAIGPYIVKNIP